jgi:hypothetical protein
MLNMMRKLLPVYLLFLLTGCASRTAQIRMLVSAPPGVPFTSNYQFGTYSGSVKTATSGTGFDTFLEIPVGDGHCEVLKDRPADALSIVASERHPTRRVNAFVPSGIRAVRFTREAGAWRCELHP